jgi:hypothetical protein
MSADAVSPEHPAPRERSVTIRRLVAADVIAYRNLMLEAYEMHVDAFTSSAAERATLPMSWWERRLRTDPAAAEIVIGALLGDTLAGVTGLSFGAARKGKAQGNALRHVRPASATAARPWSPAGDGRTDARAAPSGNASCPIDGDAGERRCRGAVPALRVHSVRARAVRDGRWRRLRVEGPHVVRSRVPRVGMKK